jgi:Cu-Zn family superoxide dismutase
MKKSLLLAALLVFAMPAFAGEAKMEAPEPATQSRVAAPVAAPAETPVSVSLKLNNAEGKETGSATVTAAPRGLIVRIEAAGLPPGWHGLHFHAAGDCSDHADHFKKSGAHLDREGETHGFFTGDGPHAGDLPNIFAGNDGVAKAEFYTAALDLDTLQDKDGAAVMIHAGADDYRTAPSGDSGERLACGVVPAAKEEE